MKRKLFSVLLTVAFVTGLILIPAAPAGANGTTYNVRPYTLDAVGTGTSVWSTAQANTGSSSVLLTHAADGAGSVYVDFIPPAGETLATFQTDIGNTTNDWTFEWWMTDTGVVNGPQFELRFEESGGSGWLEVTAVGLQGTTGGDAFVKETLASATLAGFGGNTPDGSSVFEWGTLTALSGIQTAVNAAWETAETGTVATAYVLTRVRVELWESTTLYSYIDDIEIADTTYYGSIQDAIDTAAGGDDTIAVAAGTYVGDLLIDEIITITGTGTPTIDGDVHFAVSTITMTGVALGTGYEWYVDSATASIQDAIDAAGSGDTINVAAGTYDEQLSITDITHSRTNLTLIGDMGDTTAGPGTSAPILRWTGGPDLVNGDVHIYQDGVDIKGFILDLNDTGSRKGYGILIQAADVEIRDNEFQLAEDGTDEAEGVGIDTATVTDTGLLVIDRNNFVAFTVSDPHLGGSLGIFMNPGGGTGTKTVSNNVFSGSLYGGVELHTGYVNVTDNVMTGIAATPTLGTFGVHIGSEATSAIGNITVSGNDISQFGTGIDVFSPGSTGAVTVTIENNVVEDNTEGVYANAEAVLTVNYNAISGNTDGVIYDTNATSVDAKYNWWGNVAGPTTSPATNPYEAHNTGADTISAGVDYLPWMIHTSLVSGWNIYSPPITSGTSTDTIDEALDLFGSGTESSNLLTIAYYYDSSATPPAFAEATSLTPLQAVYLNMSTASTISVLMSTDYSAPPSRTMYAGWNLVGPAQLYSMEVDDALATAYYVAGDNNIGWGQVVSPGLGQTVWSGMRGATIDTGSDQSMLPTEGYWVNMVNQGSLAGFTSTPIEELP